MVTVPLSDLLDAFDFANAGTPYENRAFIHLDTGAIHWTSAMVELEEEPPEDLETSDRYLALPYKNELDLGRELALSFVDQELPGEYDRCSDFFHHKGGLPPIQGLSGVSRCAREVVRLRGAGNRGRVARVV